MVILQLSTAYLSFLLIHTLIGAEDRNRTGTIFEDRRILSPVRLPVPPPRQFLALPGTLCFIGSQGGIRTHNLPVNSRVLHR